jgi:uncharacterized protein (DUF427 family)
VTPGGGDTSLKGLDGCPPVPDHLIEHRQDGMAERDRAEQDSAQYRGAETQMAANGKPVESVWDFPRPPRLEPVPWRIRVLHRGEVIVDAPEALRVVETSQPPAYYVSPGHVAQDRLAPSGASTWCEWKGRASYVDVVVGAERVADAGWHYDRPTPGFEALAGWYAFYAQKLDACFVDDEAVAANQGSFYGGWITANVTGPFKGAAGTMHW